MSEFEQKVISLLEVIDNKLDKICGGISSSSIKAASSSFESTIKPSAIIDKQEEERLKEKPPVEGRRVCSKCGGTTFRTERDKSQILMQQGGMKLYAKKDICKQCGNII